MGVAVEPNDELYRTVLGRATFARASDLRLPVGVFLVELAECFAALGDRRPGFFGSRNAGDETAVWNRHFTLVRRFAFRHTEATGLLGRRGKVRCSLGHGVRGLHHRKAKQEEQGANSGTNKCTHAADGSTGFLLAASLDSAYNPPGRMLKQSASVVLASLRPSTYPRGYDSALRSLWPCWADCLTILLLRMSPCL